MNFGFLNKAGRYPECEHSSCELVILLFNLQHVIQLVIAKGCLTGLVSGLSSTPQVLDETPGLVYDCNCTGMGNPCWKEKGREPCSLIMYGFSCIRTVPLNDVTVTGVRL